MNTHPSNMAVFDAAFAILAQQPLPPDAESRLIELEKQLSDSDLDFYGDVWEAFYAAGGISTVLDR